MKYCYNGNLVEDVEKIAGPHSRGLMYGDGCFDTLMVDNGHTFRLHRHLARLKGAISYLCLNSIPVTDEKYCRSTVANLLAENNLLTSQAWVRIQVWREGSRGYSLHGDEQTNWAIQCGRYNPGKQEPVSLVGVPTRRIPSESLSSRYKLANGLNYIRASVEAARKNADGPLMLTTDGWVSETNTANIFWVKDNAFYTPSPDCDLLPGITREFVIEIIKHSLQAPVYEDKFRVQHLKSADFAFICNSLQKVRKVKKMDNKEFPHNQMLFSKLQQKFDGKMKEQMTPL